ncbi:HAD-IB family hydrolase [Streptomyces xanthochromogenes]|uniref:HAD family hydrolase n=1 Tax=Streptomyces xanthochromogenes TaxID=67384 RepID=UPI0034322D13
MTTRVAFFDVDETLISVKSMFDFYAYYLDAVVDDRAERARLDRELADLRSAGLPREEGNRRFYAVYAGHEARAVEELGRRWFADRLAAGGFFHDDVLATLRRLSREGVRTVLVSGSFGPCLDPIARYAGADDVLCTRLQERGGRYTPTLLRTMIGTDKAVAAAELMARSGARPEHCHAFGDHTSDLDLLRLVGRPCVIGDDPALGAVAEREGWPRLAPGRNRVPAVGA